MRRKKYARNLFVETPVSSVEQTDTCEGKKNERKNRWEVVYGKCNVLKRKEEENGVT